VGKLTVTKRDLEAVATSHWMVMGKPARTAFFCTSSSLLMYFETHGSSSHHYWMLMKREAMSVTSNAAVEEARCWSMSWSDTTLL
jgi:hypothetical protein